LLHPIPRPCQPLGCHGELEDKVQAPALRSGTCFETCFLASTPRPLATVRTARRTLLSRNCLLPFVCTFQ